MGHESEMIRTLIILIAFVMPSGILCGQTPVAADQLEKKYQKKYKSAQECLKKNKLEDAREKLSDILDEYPGFLDGLKSLSHVYLKEDKPEKALETLLILDTISPTVIPPVKMEIANLSENTGNYPLAIRHISELLESQKLRGKLLEQATRRLAELKFRQHAYANPENLTIEKLPGAINTSNDEFLPTFTADGNSMIFSRAFKSQGRLQSEDLYLSQKDINGNFMEATPIEELNTPQNEAAHTLSLDGNTIIFTVCQRRDTYGGCDLFISSKKNGKWSVSRNMGSGINSRYWDAQPCIANNNRTIIFSSSRPGGYGAADLWRIDLLPDNQWSEPVNLGPQINTVGNEESPFLHPDNQTLYFRSDGHIGLGDYDIFVARQDSFNTWQDPQNLSFPINTKGNDGALTVDLKGNKAYYATDALNDGVHLDVCYFDLPEAYKPLPTTYLKLLVTDAITLQGLQATVELVSLSNPERHIITRTNNQGELLSAIPVGEYAMSIDHPDYIFHSENIKVDSVRTAIAPVKLIVSLYKLQPDTQDSTVITQSFILQNIFFESGSSVLLPASGIELDRLARMMIQSPEIEIKITGHTDNIGSEEDNQILSQSRAEAVYLALVDRGIPQERITFAGKGESEPIADNNTEEGRAQNRRTEFMIIR